MATELIEVEKIRDNPYNPRSYYKPDKVADIASSIEQIGLIEVPQARRPSPDVFELAYGGYRLRAYQKLAKKDKAKWGKMPLEIVKLTDKQMALFALEENLKREDMTPLDTARAVDNYLEKFKDSTEEELATKLSMAQATISNMRRVIRLPKSVLEKVNEGKINFTMARELCILTGLSAGTESEWSRKEKETVKVPIDDEYLMLDAVRKIGGNTYNPTPATVNGIRKAIYETVNHYFHCLDKDAGYSSKEHTLFDIEKAGCLKCDKMVKTARTQSDTAHHCTDEKCWLKHQKDHKEKAAAEANARMVRDIATRVVKQVENIPQGISGTGTKPVLVPPTADKGKPAGTPATVKLEPEDIKVLEALQKKDEESESSKEAIHARERRQQLASMSPDYPCLNCANIGKCAGTGVRSEIVNGKFTRVCKEQVATIKEATEKAKVKVPAGLLDKVASVAGTRAEILDLRDLRVGNYDLAQGHVLLDNVLREMSDPAECIERCTHGFHYAFDSSKTSVGSWFVCTEPRCCAKKKAAFTREKNARGLLKKKAEMKAIKRAVDETTTLDVPRVKLIFLTCMRKFQTGSYYSSNQESNVMWLLKKLKLDGQFKEAYDAREHGGAAVMKKLGEMPLKELYGFLIEFMLTRYLYEGDLKDYRIESTEALDLLHIGVELPKEALDPETAPVKKEIVTAAVPSTGSDEEESDDSGDDEETEDE